VDESDHYVGNLHPGVIDVILNVDFPAGVPQQPDEGVSEDGIAEVADVRRFVGIDAGVLDQNLSRWNFGGRLPIGRELRGQEGSINFDIQISWGRNLNLGNALDWAHFSPNRLGNLQWGRAQRLGERKDGNGKVAEFNLRRLFDHYRRQRRIRIPLLETVTESLGKTML
jgi:hypothetical protein